MFTKRTDLAIEAHELWQESAGALSQRRHAVNAAALVCCQRGYLAVLAVRNVRDHDLKL